MTRLVCLLVLGLLIALALPAPSDIVHTIDQGKLGGVVTLASGADTLTLTDDQGNAQDIRLIDLDEVRFNVDAKQPQAAEQLLIDNDQGAKTQRKVVKVKLRAGLHRITLPYWQASGDHLLTINVAGPATNGQLEPGSNLLRCFRNTDDDADPSAGVDEQGYRLPELELKVADDRRRMLTRARYRLYTGDESAPPNSVRSIAGMQLKRSGTTSAINTGMLNEHNEHVGLVFDAFFKADKDGEYTFILRSNDGSQLYLGQVEKFTSTTLGDPALHTPWHAELAHNGRALGELKAIANETMTFHVPLVSDVTIALSHTRAVWDRKADKTSINRDNEPGNEDTVYLRDKNDDKIIRSVSGKISSLDETNLTFVFRGKERAITRDRVVGLVFKHESRPKPESLGMHQVLELQGGQVLPARVKSIGDHIAFDLMGGGQATPPRAVVSAMRVENGRRIDLTQVKPSAEEAIPYFGLKLPYKVNTDFAGKPITLYNEKTYARGLAVHSKSRLHYKLRTNCERFQATFGLLNPGGKLGDITARVLGDGKVLWEQDNITAATKAIEIDVLLKGVERLILEVDFGQGQDVGDRAAWCNPRLIYAIQEQDQP